MRKIVARNMVLVVLFILMICTVNASGQEYPVKAVNVYLGYNPGGGTHQIGTVICEGMKKHLKQPFVMNFKPGAAQAIAAEFVANSAPDGYTIFMFTSELAAKLAKDEATVKFRIEDFDMIGAMASLPYVLVVNGDSQWKTVEDFVAAAKKSPGKMNYGSSGVATITHLIGELFGMRTGIAWNHIPFQGGGPQVSALLGNHIDSGIATTSTYGDHLKPGGKARGLVVFEPKRLSDLPDIPTAAERKIDVVVNVWYGFNVPKGTPKAVKNILIQALKDTTNDEQVISMLHRIPGVEKYYLNPEQAGKKLQEEYVLFKDVWKKMEAPK